MPIVITKVEKNLGKVAFLLIYSLVVFWFLVSAESIFTGWETSWTFNAIIYVLGVTLFLSVIDDFPEELKSSAKDNLIYFSGACLITLFLLLIAKDFGLLFQNVSQMPYHLIPANMAFHLIIVSASEEIIFRGVIFGYLYDHFKLRPKRQGLEVKKYGWVIPYFGSALIFAIYHYAVYGIDLINMVTIFAMGLVFAYAVERWGLGASIGAHWIWNCMAIGIITFGQ